MQILTSFLCNQWQQGNGKVQTIYHAITGEIVSLVNSDDLDFKAAVEYGRESGKVLRKLTFHQRATLIKNIAIHLQENKEKFYEISSQTGATQRDSGVDIEGGIGTLFALSSLAKKELPDSHFLVEENTAILSKEGGFIGRHILTSKQGIALHINAYNFPTWGALEKLGTNIIAGVPAILKPASNSAYLTHAVIQSIIEANILPKGTLQLICGSIGDTLEHLDVNDIVSFTGSHSTALKIKTHPNLVDKFIPVNVEADSLNACILGSNVQVEDEEFALFIKEITNELSTKAGQRCTCIRRILVPKNKEQIVIEHLKTALAKKVVGDPAQEGVHIGALINKEQVKDIQIQLDKLSTQAEIVYQGSLEFRANDCNKGAFFPLTLLKANKKDSTALVHQIEVFGPVASVIGYDSVDEGIELVKAGKGSLVSSIFSNDIDELKQWLLGTASYLGRMLLINRENAKQSTGHGTVMPQLVHGGPGRAGSGEELGGMRGVKHYMQRTAIQGNLNLISAITKSTVL